MASFGLGLPLGVSGQAAQEEEDSEEMSSTDTSSCLRFQLVWHMVRSAALPEVSSAATNLSSSQQPLLRWVSTKRARN